MNTVPIDQGSRLFDMNWALAGPDLAALVIGYLLGTIPFGLVLTRAAGLGDIRAIGSGNIGATNVLRTGRKSLAAATLVLDALKGTAAVLLGNMISPHGAIIAGFAAFVGHIFPVWLRFRGGKGVATYLGVLIALSWQAAIVFAVVWLVAAAASRYSSVGALTASLVTAPALFFLGKIDAAGLYAVLTIILWLRHAENIARLASGSESKIGLRR
jgi:acyl phosphate:glycerol-3-phosphate acyltransferase